MNLKEIDRIWRNLKEFGGESGRNLGGFGRDLKEFDAMEGFW